MRLICLLLISSAIAVSCTSEPQPETDTHEDAQVAPGDWRFVLKLDTTELPFTAKLELLAAGRFQLDIFNAGERIHIEEGEIKDDSIFFRLPAFDSEFRGRLESPYLITGNWINHAKTDYKIPFIAEHGKSYRFTDSTTVVKIPERYKVTFTPESEEPYNAILLLTSNEDNLSGTFLTETGDYRFLEGDIMNGKLYLSAFDGSHAFYFSADIQDSSLTNGLFKSGTHFQSSWTAIADTTYALRDPTELTSIEDGTAPFDFQLPNTSGDTVSWKDLDLEDRVVIVDITGSWCPNCMDANRALHKLLSAYTDKQVRLLPIYFETTGNLEEARASILRMQKETGTETPFLFGGRAHKDNVAEALPMLEDFMSFPTLIFVGKDRRVAEVYTGFYGPGTGEHYHRFMTDTRQLLDSLVAAPADTENP